MTRRAAAGLVLLLALACRHPSKVGTPASEEAARAPEGGSSRAQEGVPPRGEHPRVPSSPKALLAHGAIGKIQDALAERGYLGAHRTGALDDRTTEAIRKFQRDQGLADTGFPDRLTLRLLGLDPETAYGKVREGKDDGGAGSEGSRRGGR